MSELRRSKRVSVRFEITAGTLADAMAIDARDSHLDADHDPEGFGTEDPRLRHHVEGMSRTAAFRALRLCLWSYGAQSWPDDIPSRARAAALVKAQRWLA